jgi:hypothetical protein
MRFYSRDPKVLLIIGALCSGYGIYLIKRGYEGDTLLPGTSLGYLPKWLFYLAGVLLQIPLPMAYLFLKSQAII